MMKTKKKELDVDFIGGQGSLNAEQEKALSNFFKTRKSSVEGQFWKSLTLEQKWEIYLAYEESNDDKKLIDWGDIKKRF
jgi:hypothetical protein